MKELLELFVIFCRIGGFTFGGGYAMLPIIQKEIVEKRKWATDEEVLDYYAIGQCTPGIIAVNTATFIGYKRKGMIGAIAATMGMVFPSLVIITLIAAYFRHFQDYAIVKHAFVGIRAAVAALILSAVVKMWDKSIKDSAGLIIFILSFAVIAFTNVSPILVIVVSAIAGILLSSNSKSKSDSNSNSANNSSSKCKRAGSK
ncbi:MAG TPA: chromate transporter [Clostridiales bacterium]|nr:chromate transporter [Clostridiales bacterium]